MTNDRTAAAIIFFVTAVIFLFSRVHQIADSNYSMLLSESLLHHHSFTLDSYLIAHLPPQQQAGYISNGSVYQIEIVGDHFYYYFPSGSSLLSLPYVATMNLLGITATKPDGSYNSHGETKIEASLAALLMATLSAVIFFTARLLLPPFRSLVVTFGSAFGTQIWSTTSRALWSDTWGILLLGFAVWMLVGVECKRYKLRPILLATLCAWMYFVRPTFAIPVTAMTFYLLIYQRPAFTKFVVTGLAWIAAFFVFSEYHYRQLVPSYYAVNRLSFDNFVTALAGNLISPSRGLLVFVPVLILVAYVLFRHRGAIPLPRLTVMGVGVIIIHLVVVSSFTPWWGGHSFGPRYTAGLVPWFALLAMLALAAQTSDSKRQAGRIELAVGVVLLSCSIAISAIGANSHAASRWNLTPVNVDDYPERVWDWKHPQFLPWL